MKIHPDLNPENLLISMMSSDLTPKPVGREGSAMEIAEASKGLQEALADFQNKIKLICIGCGDPFSILEIKCCECGGFVCAACETIEEDGVCDHEIPDYGQGEDNDE